MMFFASVRRRRSARRTVYAACMSTAISYLVLAVTAQSSQAMQSIGWTVAPSVLLDTEFSGDTQIGPGLTLELELRAERSLSWWGGMSVARTDFPVGPDELHRNWGAAALGLRLMRDGQSPAVGVILGIGALFWDDLSETDPAFRSSANAEEMLLPGVEVRIPVRNGFGVSVSVRDQMTGWWWAVLDPEEGSLNHRVMITAGLYHW